MQIKIFDGPIKTSQAQYDYIMNKVRAATRRLRSPAACVQVRLADVNGPKGGVDKRCAVLVTAPGLNTIRVQAHANDYYTAIHAAAASLRRVLSRSLERLKTNGPR